MIIRLDGASADHTQAARQGLEAMARSWGQEIDENPAEVAAAAGPAPEDGKAIDPVAAASLVLSVPSAALAALDLADRIGKRRRAAELIGHAQQEAGRQVTTWVISRSRTVELRALTPDQLLDLLAEDDPASPPAQA